MMKKLLFSMSLALLIAGQLLAQKVPYSSQIEDQLLQGPCYVFAAVAAMETKALQAKGYSQGGHAGVDFNEWRYWSDCAMGNDVPNASSSLFVKLPMEHMKQFGAVQTINDFRFTNKSQLPNSINASCGPYGGIAGFQCTSGGPLGGGPDNLNWCDQYGGYKLQSNGSCTEEEPAGRKFSFNQYVAGGTPDFSFNNVTVNQIIGSGITTQAVINQLAAGNGVVAVIENFRNDVCNDISYAVEHAIYIYEHTNGVFYYKDSWPGAHTTNRGSMTTQDFNNHQVAVLVYASGNATCNNCTPAPTGNCDYEITGPSEIGCGTATFQLTGGSGASNISWQVPQGVTVVGGVNSATLEVTSNNCGLDLARTIQVTYTDGQSCADSRSITVKGGNVTQPTGIQLNGPVSGQISDVCPGSAVQLVAIDNNSEHCPIYEWYVSGATILNGQGTNTVNIQTNNVDGAYQYYRVRAKKACGSYSAWRTRTGYLDDCSGGGGIGIFPPGFGLTQVLGADELFSGHPSLQEMEVQIISISGKKLLEFRIQRNQQDLDLSHLPSGLLVARFYDLNQNLLDTKKISIVR